MRRGFKAGASSGLVAVSEERSLLPGLGFATLGLARWAELSSCPGSNPEPLTAPRALPWSLALTLLPAVQESPSLLSPLLTKGTIYPVLFALLPAVDHFPGLSP